MLTESTSTAPIPGTVTQPFERAYADLVQALQDVLATTPQQDGVNARYMEYSSLLQAVLAGQDVQAQCTQAYALYIAALQEALATPQAHPRALEAFARYARATRDGWASVDPGLLTPEITAAIAQQMLSAASTLRGVTRN